MKSFLACITALLCLGLCNCGAGGIGSSGAETQASLPISEEAGFTISSPDAQGLVTIVGSEAVPAGVTIIAEVSAATTSSLISFDKFANLIIPSAMAATECSALTGIDECPSLNDDGKCYFIADAEGDASFQVPAGVGDSITLSYLDATTCAETEVFEGAEVDNENLALNLLPRATTFNQDDGVFYVLGMTVDENNALVYEYDAMDTATQALTTQTFPTDFVGIPQRIDYFKTNDRHFLTIQGSQEIAIAEVFTEAADLPSSDAFATVDNSQAENSSFLVFLSAETFNTGVAFPCNSSVAGTEGGDIDYSRVFYTDSHQLFVQEFGAVIGETDLPTTVHIEITDTASGGAPVPSVARLVYFSVQSDETDSPTVEFIVGTGTASDLSYYFFSIPRSQLESDLCTGTLSVDLSADGVPLGQFVSAESLQFERLTVDVGGQGAHDYIAILDVDAQQTAGATVIALIPTSAEGVSRVNLSYDSTENLMSASIDSDETNPLPAVAMPDLGGNITRMTKVNNDSGASEIFLLAGDFDGSQFYTGSETASEVQPGSPLLAKAPLRVYHDRGLNKLITIDRTRLLSGSEYEDAITNASHGDPLFTSFIRFYPLSEGGD